MIGGRRAKGFFFTLLVVVLFFLVLLSARAWTKQQETYGNIESVKARAYVMRGAVDSMEGDGARITGIGANRSAYYGAFYVAYNRTPMGNAALKIAEIFLNGTLNGSQCYSVPTGTCSPGSTSCCFVNQTSNTTLEMWNRSISAALARHGFNASLRSASVAVSQSGPFELRAVVNGEISVNDTSGVASYRRQVSLSGIADITGFEDPAYSVYTNGTKRRYLVPYPNGYTTVTTIATGSRGSGWFYGNVSNFVNSTNCSALAGNKNTTLVVDDIGTFMTTCLASVNAYGGVICNSNSNGTQPYIPYVQVNGTNITLAVSNGTSVLLDNDDAVSRHVVLNIENFRALMMNSTYYRLSTNGPDYLNRLQYDFVASSHGTESFINYSMDTPGSNRSWVDYFYLNGTGCNVTGCFKIKGTQNCEDTTRCANGALSHFLLDNMTAFRDSTAYVTHTQYYGVDELAIPN